MESEPLKNLSRAIPADCILLPLYLWASGSDIRRSVAEQQDIRALKCALVADAWVPEDRFFVVIDGRVVLEVHVE